MSGANTFDWVPFYKELAGNLLPYKNNRPKLIEDLELVCGKSETKMPVIGKSGNLADIDPFTVFSLFNKKDMPEDKRAKIADAVAKVFSISAPIPSSFADVPVLNQLSATYYYLRDPGDTDVDDLWELFDAALKYAHDKTPNNKAEMSKYFDVVIKKKGMGNSKITIGLFWVAPDVFLNLDGRNVWYIYESEKIPADVVQSLPKAAEKITAEKYFEIADTVEKYLQTDSGNLKSFLDLSNEAWRYSEEVNKEEEKKKKDQKAKKAKNPPKPQQSDLIRPRYWLYSPGEKAKYWDEFRQAQIMAIGWDEIGDLSKFADKSEMQKMMTERIDSDSSNKNAANATWQFVHEVKPGDVVFVKRGRTKIIGRGIVRSDYKYDASRGYYKNVREVEWLNNGEWDYPWERTAVSKTLTDMTPFPELVENLKNLFPAPVSPIPPVGEKKYEEYKKDKFLDEVYISKEEYDELVGLLEYKKNVILQGPPGVGKTFAAKRLAYSIMGEKDDSRIEFVQFHQNYSYEDFVMGYKPSDDKEKSGDFSLKEGVFFKFCERARAEKDPGKKYFFIIDEINRGNMSKIFGELLMLIENDKRGNDYRVKLPYTDKYFSIPDNLYIIGMMNTADRSLAMIDYALRRRFAFFTMVPAFEKKGFQDYLGRVKNEKLDKLIAQVKKLNEAIAGEKSLGEGFCIGHSYFCGLDDDKNPLTPEEIHDRLAQIVNFEIKPMINEYCFDDSEKNKEWTDILDGKSDGKSDDQQ